MANDYIPRREARFHAGQNNFVMYAKNHQADLGLAAATMWTSTTQPQCERATTQPTPPVPAINRG